MQGKLDAEQMRAVHLQAKAQQLEFQSQKQISQLQMQIATLLRLKSACITGALSQADREVFAEDGELPAQSPHLDDANFFILDQQDQKLQQLESENLSLKQEKFAAE